jgi:sulfonate transport system permease protein
MSDTRAIPIPARPFALPATAPALAAVAPRLGRLRRFASPLLLVLLWQAASMAGLISPRTLAAPSTVLASAWELLLSGELPRHLLVSLGRVALGLGIGVTAGVAFALVAGLSRLGEDIVDAPLQMLRTLPFLALVPLFILWFGIGEVPKIALVALGTTFHVYLTLFAGIRGVDPKLVGPAACSASTAAAWSATWCCPAPCRPAWWGCATPWAPPG